MVRGVEGWKERGERGGRVEYGPTRREGEGKGRRRGAARSDQYQVRSSSLAESSLDAFVG